MAKNNNNFACQECGSVYKKWVGKCNGCGSWDSIVEEISNDNFKFAKSSKTRKNIELFNLDGDSEKIERFSTNIEEFDRVLGGGIVKGSATLIGGDPGIGKSTLVLQTLISLDKSNIDTLYISGEESVDQIRIRAKRLNIDKCQSKLASATCVNDIISTIDSKFPPKVIIIDSIQTMYVEEISSAPGSVSQVRASCHELITFAKAKNISLLIVGHVTKEGQIAGPKILEHMVDTVIYFEGDRSHQFRLLRSIKNRFGAANEIGIFEMQQHGLVEIKNPSALFLEGRDDNVAGSVVFAGIEGTRPVLAEIQALVSPTSTPMPRRAVVGSDSNRLAMILAILQTRYGLFLSDKDIYLNVVGGLKINEPAADLAIAAAIISSVTSICVPKNYVIFGEIGLSGEVRNIAGADVRVKEAKKLGFTNAILPYCAKHENKDFILHKIKHINDFNKFFVSK